MPDYEVAVIGAGPVGSYIAARLAGSGCRVAVFDSSSSTEENVCCTGIVSTECYKQFIAPLNIAARPARSATIFSPSGQSLHIERPETQAYVIDRPALNRALAERAMLLGTEYHFNSRVVGVELSLNSGMVRLQQQEHNSTIAARMIVLACGLSSAIPRKLGLGRITYCAVGAQAGVKTSINEVQIYFDQEMAPGGFAWLVPTWEGNGLAGIISHYNATRHLVPFIERLRSSGKISSVFTVRQKAIPMTSLQRTSDNRVIVVGEAAGQVKPTTCGGIYTGILSAEMAVTTIRNAFETSDFSGERLAEYDRAWKTRLQADLRKGYLARRYYDTLSNHQIENIFQTIKNTGLHELLLSRQDFSFDWHGRHLLRLLKQPRVMTTLLTSGIGHSPGSLAALIRLLAG